MTEIPPAPGPLFSSLSPVAAAWGRFFLPFLIIGCYLIFVWALFPEAVFLALSGLMLAYLIPPAGKESVIPIGIAIGLPWWLVALSMTLMDAATAVFMALNFDLALKIPILGGWIGDFMAQGRAFFYKRPWIERLSFFGLAVFVMFPLQGTGGIAGSIVGRMLGLSPLKVVLAISAGAFAGCFLIALGAEYVREVFLSNTDLGVAVIVAISLAIGAALLFRQYRAGRLRERHR